MSDTLQQSEEPSQTMARSLSHMIVGRSPKKTVFMSKGSGRWLPRTLTKEETGSSRRDEVFDLRAEVQQVWGGLGWVGVGSGVAH